MRLHRLLGDEQPARDLLVREALDHLLSLGHSDIGFIGGPQSLNSARRRKDAFRAALRAHGLHVRSEWIAEGDMRIEGGRTAMQRLLACNPRPTAVLASNDLMAVGALQAAQAARISVPKNLSLIGFDDIPQAGWNAYQLTTFRQPVERLTSVVMDVLRRRREHAAPAHALTTVPIQLVVRSTVRGLSASEPQA